MNALNKPGTIVAVIFVVCLVALVFEILYVLWRRRSFRQRCGTIFGDDMEVRRGDSLYTTPSKELLYFFRWKNQRSHVEPDSTVAPVTSTAAPSLPADATDAVLEEMLKLQGLYRPSTVLFTIKEEEIESDASAGENNLVNSKKRKKSSGNVFFEEIPDVVVEVDDSATPFWTPCASPQYYYTPSPSPSRDGNGSSMNSGSETEDIVVLGVSGDSTV